MSNNPDMPLGNNSGKDHPETGNREPESAAPSEDSQVSVLEAEIARLKDQWMRAVAETENLRRRAQREREEASKYASANFSRDMLTIADNLRRALESCPVRDGLPPFAIALIEGIELTESALLTAFERYGIKKISPLQEKFDPNLHQAMLEIEDSAAMPGTVVQVLQTGYVMHDRLLRPAMVGVSRQPAEAAPVPHPDASLRDNHGSQQTDTQEGLGDVRYPPAGNH